ncbi:hypothetical protein NC981_24330 [Leptolyngbya sp. DQ-M1]|uniref:hypothetical protein n=1 Tax=Leptolyngbya sp. DQ-M1 TaxID=2933920 RepID=UPI0032984A7B
MKRRALIATASLTMALSSLPMLGSPSYAETVNIPVPKAAVATAFNAAFSSTKVRLHKDESYILLPNGQKKPLDTPDPIYVFDFPGINRNIEYSLNDMNTHSIQATVNGNRINTDVFFENQGEEIKARCRRKLFGKWGDCSLDMERDLHLDNSSLSLSLVPAAYKGSIAFTDLSTKFKTDVRIANKTCNTVLPPVKQICEAIEGKIKKTMTPQIEQKVANSFNELKPEIADKVRNAAGIRNLINPAWKVTKVTSEGNNFIVTVERPDQIDGSSVKDLSLRPIQTQFTSTCPAKVKLDATIQMKHTVAGTGFLTYENGQKSNTFNWNAKKGEAVTSSVTRTFEGSPGTTSNGSAVMQIQWKGSDGKTYEKTSNKATFSVKCTQSASDKIKL